jgi:hypothetical protein
LASSWRCIDKALVCMMKLANVVHHWWIVCVESNILIVYNTTKIDVWIGLPEHDIMVMTKTFRVVSQLYLLLPTGGIRCYIAPGSTPPVCNEPFGDINWLSAASIVNGGDWRPL